MTGNIILFIGAILAVWGIVIIASTGKWDNLLKSPGETIRSLRRGLVLVAQAERDQAAALAAQAKKHEHLDGLRLQTIHALEDANLAQIIDAIRTVDLVRVRVDTPYGAIMAQHGETIGTTRQKSPDPKWFQWTTRVDTARLSRIYADLQFAKNSPEYEMLVQAYLREVQNNIEAAMRFV